MRASRKTSISRTSTHVKRGKLTCESCHGAQGSTDKLRRYQVDRISGYSRDIWGGQGRPMTMDDCVDCHRESKLEHSCLDCHK